MADKKYGRNISSSHYNLLMAHMSTCPCGFTVISPRGEDDVKNHISIHLGEAHPGTRLTDEEIRKTIRSV